MDEDAGAGVLAQCGRALHVVGVRMGEHDPVQVGRVSAQLGHRAQQQIDGFAAADVDEGQAVNHRRSGRRCWSWMWRCG
jgi:hypothetical protein